MMQRLLTSTLVLVLSSGALAGPKNSLKICGYGKDVPVELVPNPFIRYPRHHPKSGEVFFLKEIGTNNDLERETLALIVNQEGKYFLVDETSIKKPSQKDFANKISGHDCVKPKDSKLASFLEKATESPDNEIPSYACKTEPLSAQLKPSAIDEINARFPDAEEMLTSDCSITLLGKELTREAAKRNGLGGNTFTTKSLVGNFVLKDCKGRTHVVKSGDLSDQSKRDLAPHSFACELKKNDLSVPEDPFRDTPGKARGITPVR